MLSFKRCSALLLALMLLCSAGLACAEQSTPLPTGSPAPTVSPIPEPVDKAHSPYVLEQVLRGVDWEMSMEEAAQIEQVELGKKPKSVKVKNVTLFDLAVPTLEYFFTDGVMTSREFMFSMKVDYTLIFYAVYYFYGAPNYNTKKTYTWEKEDMQIVLTQAKNPTLTLTVRQDAQGT